MKTIQEFENLKSLDALQAMLENCISCYAIEEDETLFDEEENELVRVLWFERGMKKHSVVISPDGFIKASDEETPIDLLMSVCNLILGFRIYEEKTGLPKV
jgi:hypothetical protein